MLKLHVLYEHSRDLRPHGCSYIRLLLPLKYPANPDAFTVTHGPDYATADVIVVERTWSPALSFEAAEDLVTRARADRARLVYTIDDNILDLELGQERMAGLNEDKLMAIRYLAREADGVLVSTEALKHRFSRFNRNIFLVPNALDERLFESALSRLDGRKSHRNPRVVGFMGTYTHGEDLMMVLQPLRRVLRGHPGKVELQLIGGTADPGVLQGFNGLPFRTLDVGDSIEYPAFVSWMVGNLSWDLAIAPLEDSPFNCCKSDIKFLDYSALGIAGIYSRLLPYEKTVRHLETGYLASNDPETWEEALERLLFDDSLRLHLARNAREYVFSNRTLKQCAKNWREAILSILDTEHPHSCYPAKSEIAD